MPSTTDLQVRRLLHGCLLLAVPVLWITADVLTDGWLRRLDDVVAAAGWHKADPGLVWAGDLLDLAGQRAYVCTLLVVVAVVLALRRRSWRPVQVTLLGLVLLNVVVGAAKVLLGRTPPAAGHDLLFTADQQFPSGHAANAALSWGLIAYLLLRYGRTRLRALPTYAAAAALSVLVCAASLYLGYHWLTDLLVGLPLGAILLLVTVAWDVRTTAPQPPPARRVGPYAGGVPVLLPATRLGGQGHVTPRRVDA